MSNKSESKSLEHVETSESSEISEISEISERLSHSSEGYKENIDQYPITNLTIDYIVKYQYLNIDQEQRKIISFMPITILRKKIYNRYPNKIITDMSLYRLRNSCRVSAYGMNENFLLTISM